MLLLKRTTCFTYMLPAGTKGLCFTRTGLCNCRQQQAPAGEDSSLEANSILTEKRSTSSSLAAYVCGHVQDIVISHKGLCKRYPELNDKSATTLILTDTVPQYHSVAVLQCHSVPVLLIVSRGVLTISCSPHRQTHCPQHLVCSVTSSDSKSPDTRQGEQTEGVGDPVLPLAVDEGAQGGVPDKHLPFLTLLSTIAPVPAEPLCIQPVLLH
eukprot:1162027-Pelagomonas_calceolata.AAC.5